MKLLVFLVVVWLVGFFGALYVALMLPPEIPDDERAKLGADRADRLHFPSAEWQLEHGGTLSND